MRRRCLAPAALGSNPRWAINPYALSRGARYSGLPPLALRAAGSACRRSTRRYRNAFVSHSAISLELKSGTRPEPAHMSPERHQVNHGRPPGSLPISEWRSIPFR
jgi:hypothetical protein